MTDVNHTVTGSEGSTNAGGSPAPGSQTDPALLLASLQEEREKRRVEKEAREKAEADLLELQNALASGDTSSEEAKLLKKQIERLEGQMTTLANEKVLSDLQAKYPVLKDKTTEFNEFQKKYPGVAHDDVAKLFLSENDLLDKPAPRRGVEKPSGGGRNAGKQGYTFAEVDNMRKNDYRRYSKLLKEGAFNDVSE